MATGAQPGPVLVWDLQTGKLLSRGPAEYSTIGGLDFSPDGGQLAAGAFQSGTVKVWDAATWQELFVLGTDQAREAQVEATPAARKTSAAAAQTATAVANSTATPSLAEATAIAQAHQSFLDLTSHWRLLFSDSFDVNSTRWTTGSYDAKVSDNRQTIAGGQYRWEIKSKQVSALALALPADLPTASPLKDFEVSVEARQVSGAANSRYGLVFRYGGDSRSFYLFDLADDGSYRFSEGSGKWPGKAEMSGTSAAVRPGQLNRLTVIGQGSHFTFFVNGQYVAEKDDARLSGGGMGPAAVLVNAGEEAGFEFDNFALRAP